MSFDAKAYLRDLKQKRKDNKLCVECGKQDNRTLQGLTRCTECSERAKEYYKRCKEKNPDSFKNKNADKQKWRELLRKNHLCLDCKKMDAYTLNGRPKCAECAEKDALRHKKWRTENREKSKAISAEYHQRYINEKRCSRCGSKLPSDYFHKMCYRCRVECREYKDEQRWIKNPDRIKRGTPGICYICVKRPVMEGKKICQQCYDQRLPIALENIKKAQANNGKHIWRMYDKGIKNRNQNP